MESPRIRRQWKARPVLAIALRVSILIVPALVALAATAAVHPLLPVPRTWGGRVAWWAGLLGLGLVVATLVERLGRRLLPLVMLLKLAMLFPDRAPSRFAVAREAGSVRRLKALLEEVDEHPERKQDAWTAQQILALAMALQSHDRQTRGHSERVRTFTDLLAEEMKLPSDDRYRLRWAALLHDIGKLTVSAKILNKPDKLDDREWEAMKRHPAEGARIAAPLLGWLGPWAGAIAEHHERFDGKGYPAGVGGHHISLGGRIVSVADAYDTMTAARSYKKPMAIRAAREELARCAGGQFDPVVVRAFLNISLPRLLWKTGPLSFLMQLPFLARLQELAQQGVTVAAQGVTAATVAAGVTAIAASGPVSASPIPSPSRTPVAVVSTVPSPSPSPRPTGSIPASTKPGKTRKGGGGTGSSPTPSPTKSPSPSPTATKSPSPEPTILPDPLPTPLPSLTPLPSPSLSPLPLPLPSTSLDLGSESTSDPTP